MSAKSKGPRTLAVPIDEHGGVGKAIEMVEVEGLVWCCVHGDVHDDREDPYGDGTVCTRFD